MITLKRKVYFFLFHGLLFAAALVLSMTPAHALTLTQFKDCIGNNTGSYGLVCQLDAGTYAITSEIIITRNAGTGNSLTVQGTYTTSLSDTTLQRTSSLSYLPIMSNQSAGKVSIYEFTFDGNRSGITGYKCAVTGDPAALTVDLDLQSAGAPTLVTFDDFINSPWDAIASAFGTSTTAKYDTFQYLTISYARTYGIYEGAHNTYIENVYEYIGTNAVILNSNALSEGEYFYSNHDEFTFGDPGGQIWIDGLSTPLGANTITITDAVIAGANQHSTRGQAAGPFSCVVPGTGGVAVGNLGIEAHNTSNVTLANNSIYNNRYQNVLIEDGTSGTTTITTYSTYCPSCSAQIIQSNYLTENIGFRGAVSGTVAFDGVMSQYSAGYGIDLEGSYTSYTITFQHNGGTGTVCLTGNTSGRLANPNSLTLTGFPATDTCPTH